MSNDPFKEMFPEEGWFAMNRICLQIVCSHPPTSLMACLHGLDAAKAIVEALLASTERQSELHVRIMSQFGVGGWYEAFPPHVRKPYEETDGAR